MNKTNEETSLIHILIKKHIETISEEGISKQEKEVDYLLVKEAVESLIREYNKATTKRHKKTIKKILTSVNNEIFTYLVDINRYDHRILELYVMLDDLLYN